MNDRLAMGPEKPVSAAVEKAYRRGYGQGAAMTHQAIVDGASLQQVAKWINDKVRPWRNKSIGWKPGDAVEAELPPDPPRAPPG